MGFLDLLVVALMPVLRVLLVTGVGMFLRIERINLLGPEAANYLNKSSEAASEPSSDSCTEQLLTPSYTEGSGKIKLPHTNLQERRKISLADKIVRCLEKVLVPSAIGAMVGLIIGVIYPLRKVLIGNNAPLRVLDGSASLIGQAEIPVITLIMGANLLQGLKRSEMNVTAILGVVAVRNVCLPLLGIGVVKAADHFGMVGSDSLYRFVLMFQYAVPPAINVGTMAQLFQSGQGETSIILFWTYALASISLTLWSTLFMSLVS